MGLTKQSIITIAVVLFVVFSVFLIPKFKKNNHSQNPIQNLNAQAQAYILPVSQASYLPIRNFNIADPETDAKAAGIYDVRSERFLYTKNINDKLPIASITKLMTAIIIIENLSLNDSFTVGAEDINVDGDGADLNKGEVIRGADLLKIMLIKSSNDATLTFSSNAAKKKINLVVKMNDKSKLIGMLDTKFNDPAGLEDNDSFSTINDLVKLVRYVGKYPIIWDILLTQFADVNSIDGRFSHRLVNTNRLLNQIPNIVGGKTGFTDGAMETMVLEVLVDSGRDQLISVILGSKNRFDETKKLIDWAKNAYQW